MYVVDLSLQILRFRTLTPVRDPVSSSLIANDVEHVFCGILLRQASSGAVLGEVVEESAVVLSDFAEVDCLATFSEEEEAVKFCEESSARLMDCAQDCLTIVCEFPEKRTDCPCALGVEATCRFVEEEEKFRLGS